MARSVLPYSLPAEPAFAWLANEHNQRASVAQTPRIAPARREAEPGHKILKLFSTVRSGRKKAAAPGGAAASRKALQ